ncbi:MAG: hypothetical protein IKE48_03290 [Parasporobacterium sp.]|nr:hypothetical protein [Parasporobacterium sp.]
MKTFYKKIAKTVLVFTVLVTVAAGGLSFGAVNAFAEDGTVPDEMNGIPGIYELNTVNEDGNPSATETVEEEPTGENQGGEDPSEEDPVDPPARVLNPGWQLIDGIWYYGNDDGTAKTGWLWYKNGWYYLMPEDGAMKTSWALVNEKWYYMDKNGKMLTGWIKPGRFWYYLSSSGAMDTGWIKYKNQWYFLDYVNGDMKTGWEVVDGIWYYFNDPNGDMRTGWMQSGNTWYYLTSWGLSYTGLAPWYENYYYVKEGVYDPTYNGKAKVSGLSREFSVVNGKVAGGVVPPSEQLSQAARAILNQTGWDIYKAYRWCIVNWTVYSVGGDYGTAYYADYGFRKRTGNCFVMAAMFTTLARELGFEAYQMAGYVGSSPHSWVEIRNKSDGKFYVCDPDFESERGNSGWCLYYGQKGTWMYNSYYRMHN